MKICPICRFCYEDAETACTRGEHGELIPTRHGTRAIAGKYRLDRLLGRGGMGAVYAGMHVELERNAAVKLLLPDLVSDAQALERFRREARAAARLNHPNVVDTYDYGLLPGGEAYIVMELVEGQTLREYMNAAHALPFAEAVVTARQVADGIEVAHRSGIVHRDLKPSNIIITRDHHDSLLAKVVDFGIAQLKEQTTSGALSALTNTGALVGTPRYMSPEQCAGYEIDARSDIYSLGVILYEMLAGKPPFDAPSATAVALKHVQEIPAPIKDLRPDMPEMLASVVMKSLAKDPDERQQSAAEFANGLRAVEEFVERGVSIENVGGAAGTFYGDGGHASPYTSTNFAPLRDTGMHGETPTNPHTHGSVGGTSRAGVPTSEMSGNVAQPTLEDESVETPVPDAVRATNAETLTQAAPSPAASGEVLHAPAAGVAHASTAQPSDPAPAGSLRPASKGLPRIYYYGLFAFLVVIGLGIFALYRGRGSTSTVSSGNTGNRAREVDPAREASPAPAPIVTSQPTPDSTPQATQAIQPPAVREEDLVEAPEVERRALRTALDGWVAATNTRSVNRQMSFYAPRLSAFYRARDTSREAVRAEKESLFGRASRVQIGVSDVVLRLGRDGRTAVTRFRKQYVIEVGGQSRSGEVLQELVWNRTRDGWKINSERDIQVIR